MTEDHPRYDIQPTPRPRWRSSSSMVKSVPRSILLQTPPASLALGAFDAITWRRPRCARLKSVESQAG